jgi:hypothetical protein
LRCFFASGGNAEQTGGSWELHMPKPTYTQVHANALSEQEGKRLEQFLDALRAARRKATVGEAVKLWLRQQELPEFVQLIVRDTAPLAGQSE